MSLMILEMTEITGKIDNIEMVISIKLDITIIFYHKDKLKVAVPNLSVRIFKIG